jgi:elongation factor P hydroxylase
VLGCEQIKAVFELEFGLSHRVCLNGGAEEPLYLPSEHQPNQIIYTRDYPASALHEIAHWCLASAEQLKLKDWGHWYTPDGRGAEQQRRFQRAEARVQAIEWALSVAAGRPFRESSDNLSGEYIDDMAFKDQIHGHILRFCDRGLPERAGQLFDAFVKTRRENLVLSAALFHRQALN